MEKFSKLIKIFVLILLLAIFVYLAVSFTLYSPFEKIIYNDDVKIYKDYSYGEHKRNRLDVFMPINSSGEKGLILLIHGGGWIAGDKSGYYSTGVDYAKKGYVAVSINYRYANGNTVKGDEILDDITAALYKVVNIATENNITLSKMMLTGGSAGGHLSLQYAYTRYQEAPIKPALAVSLSGPTDMTDVNFYQNNDMGNAAKQMIGKLCGVNLFAKNIDLEREELIAQSPIYFVGENCVPTIIAHGAKDSLVPYSNATALYSKLTALNVPCELITFENSDHGLESDPDKSAYLEELTNQYLDLYLN